MPDLPAVLVLPALRSLTKWRNKKNYLNVFFLLFDFLSVSPSRGLARET